MRVLEGLSLLALGLVLAGPVDGQTNVNAAATARVSGTVTDSLTGSPLADAALQLVMSGSRDPFALATRSDRAGAFEFDSVPAGEYLIGFLHPLLDSLGLEPIVRAISVRPGQQAVRADLALPGPARLNEAFCGAAGPPGSGLIVGFVRTANRDGISGATIHAEWLELSIRNRRMERQTASRIATSAESGRFILCDVPAPGSVILQAGLGPDSTDRFETDVPASGFLRRDIFLGDELATAGETPPGIRDAAPPADRIRRGRGRLVGTVTGADGGWPLAGARVGVVNGGHTQTNARGQWVLTGLPSGTRVLEVRAPGYLSVNRVVDIVEGAGPVSVTLPRLAAVLDTLKVVARSRSPLALSGFEERRRSAGVGRFLTAADIERRRLWDTSHLFDYIPGLKRSRSDSGEDVFLMASAFGEGCVPAVFINGQLFQNLAAQDLDVMIEPRNIAAMEVYRETQVPPEFQAGLSGCGSIVIWTR
jgi:hypothetical protein